MIEGLIGGKLHGTAQTKTAKTGKPFTTAKVKAHAGDGEVFVNVVAFSDSAQAALLALGDGDAVALAGALKPTAWIDREGNARPSLDMVAAQVLTVYHIGKRRKAMQGGSDTPQADHPSQEAWEARKSVGYKGSRGFDDDLDDGGPLDF